MLNFIKKWMENSVIDEIIILIFMLVIVEAIAQNTIKQSDPESLKLVFGLTAYVIIGYLLHYAYHKYPLSKINVMWSCMSIIVATIFGYMLYDESFNKKTMLAVTFAILAIYFSYIS